MLEEVLVRRFCERGQLVGYYLLGVGAIFYLAGQVDVLAVDFPLLIHLLYRIARSLVDVWLSCELVGVLGFPWLYVLGFDVGRLFDEAGEFVY